MANFVPYTPSTAITRAMFNFDEFDLSNFRVTGVVRISTSDGFSLADFNDPAYSAFSADLITGGDGEVNWTPLMLANIEGIANIYSQFANITFQFQGDFDSGTFNPEDVGRAGISDINITWINTPDLPFAGVSGIGTNSEFNYTRAAGDIFLNVAAFDDTTLNADTEARQTLMHELGHSLGLSHPHLSDEGGVRILTPEYAATRFLGFQNLGFPIFSAADMDKEYFTIMSYDDQNIGLNAHTPMILDVIALQQAYGEGPGTSGSGNDTIVAGNLGYRTYFDTGGVDTIDLQFYEFGAYLHMGTPITGAAHQVGVAMDLIDFAFMVNNGEDPFHLRWFYGEFENAIAGPAADYIEGNSLANSISGLGGDDIIDGNGGADNIEGGAGNDTLFGGNGNDVLDGEAGADMFYGEAGNDIYVLDDAGDEIIELSGTDTVQTALASLTLPAGVERLEYTGGGNFSGTGNNLANRITGGAGNDVLDGGAGADRLIGGAGNDAFVIDNAADSVLELAGPDVDTIQTARGSLSLAAVNPLTLAPLYANVENLTYTGSGNFDGTGSGAANVLTGGTGKDILRGGNGDDTLIGGAGNDTLNGGGGIDDTVLSGVRADYVFARLSLTSVRITNGATGEVDVLNTMERVRFGDSTLGLLTLDDLLLNTASPFTDFFDGGSGNDTFDGLAGNDVIHGNGGDDTLAGSSGNDQLDGGAGDDNLDGGVGDDLYFIDSVDDQITDAGGIDTVQTALASLTLAGGIDRLLYTGVGDFSGTGNALANRITGGDGNDQLDGGAGADRLIGGAGNDTYVIDNAADSVLELAGPDIDTIQTARASLSLGAVNPVTLAPLYTNVENLTYTGSGNFDGTGNGVANVLTGGGGNDVLRGGGGNDSLIGGDGNDRLSGGPGNDLLDGGTGSDAFVFAHAPGAANADQIVGFESGADRLQFDDAVFAALGAPGALAASRFNAGDFSSGQDASDRIIYNTSTGELFYDADGSGGGAALLVATLDGSPDLLASDIQII